MARSVSGASGVWGLSAAAVLIFASSSSHCEAVAADTCPLDDPLGRIRFHASVVNLAKFSGASYSANRPIEDRFAFELEAQHSYVSVFDGHGGWQAAEYAEQHLIANAKKEMPPSDDPLHNDTMIAKSLVRAFERTDREFLTHVRPSFDTGFGSVARVGACALLAFVSSDGTLFVANAGDVRAVLAHRQRSEASKMIAVPMSDDHNAKIPREKERLAAEHPDEPDIVRCKSPESCYVKGRLQPTRSLGDFYLKYSEFNGPAYGQHGDRSRGRHVPAPYTPPYISATPEIQSRKLMAGDTFLIIGSDGVWDFLDNQEAVAIVQRELELKMPERASKALIEAVLQKAAQASGLSLEELLALPPGGYRRRLHDDTTAVVLFFNNDSN